MTSISSTAASCTSPLDRLKSQLASDVASGTIASGDQSALSSALDAIDTSLKAGRQASQGQLPSPSDMRSKLDALISGQVEAGTLTSDQATELKSVFSETFKAGHGGGHGKGGPRAPEGASGAGGPPPVPPPSDGTSADAADPTDGSDNTSDTTSLVAKFLKQLQQSLNPASSYGQDGSTASSSLSVLLDVSA